MLGIYPVITEMAGHDNHFHIRFPTDTPIRIVTENDGVIKEETIPYSAASPTSAQKQVINIEIKDIQGYTVPQHSLVYITEVLPENSPQSSDLIAIYGESKELVPLRTDENGILSIEVGPKALGTAVVNLYRPNEMLDGVGYSSDTMEVRNLIGKVKIKIEEQ